MYSNLSGTKYHENYPFMRLFKIEVPNVVGYLKSKMSTRHHLSDYDRRQAVGRLEADQSVTTVAAAMGVSKSVI
ncbi:hypothetical protein TNCV_4150151 [Trichonephila clavipes]|uniref:Uncharacterized protein n=1 Tax=Trichonephila clavipes TaxID=2585209 RepID=A0A8X6W5K5_TRICX|nr:hypothetical protein TNCV_4150151 [Trichonephila clavipes]